MTTRKYEASGVQAEFEPGSRNRVLRNLLGVVRERDMELIESYALAIVQDAAPARYGRTYRFRSNDVRDLHRSWLGRAYAWAGEYRTVDVGKGGFQFAHAARIPFLMEQFESEVLQRLTPCVENDHDRLAAALAEVHAELILIHPFRDGNGRLARLLAVLMARQAGVEALDFRPLDRSGAYIAGIHQAMGRNYGQLAELFRQAIEETVASSKR
jgi:cell filamentation protein